MTSGDGEEAPVSTALVAQGPTKPLKVSSKKPGGDWAPTFLKVLAERGVYAVAAKAAGVTYHAAYLRRQRDPEFDAAVREADEQFTGKLLDAAYTRALTMSDRLLDRALQTRHKDWHPKAQLEVMVPEIDFSKCTEAEIRFFIAHNRLPHPGELAQPVIVIQEGPKSAPQAQERPIDGQFRPMPLSADPSHPRNQPERHTR